MGWRAGKVRGIVAHSQGEMVAASLLQNYSYVFADAASSRPPNVISVGTPYEGTRLLDAADSGIFRVILQAAVRHSTDGCTIPYELFRNTNYKWANKMGWRTKYQTRAFTTQHSKSTWHDPRNCGRLASSLIRNSDDGVISSFDGNEFADGGYTNVKKYCHYKNGNQGDQWYLPGFVSAVNQTFYARTEVWQPF